MIHNGSQKPSRYKSTPEGRMRYRHRPNPPRDRRLPDMSRILPLYYTVEENPDAADKK